jgi:chromosomal replication initiation ATPase DnaA
MTDRVMVADLIDATAEITGICRAKLFGPSRTRPIARARKVIYLLGERHGHPFALIGRRLGGIDHSSVSRGREVACRLIDTDSDFAVTVAEVEARAYGIAAERKTRVQRALPVEWREAA